MEAIFPVKDFFLRSKRWLEDVELYEELYGRWQASTRRRSPVSTAVTNEDLLILRKLRLEEGGKDVRSFVNFFFRDEIAKARRRILEEPILNDVITKDDLQYTRAATKATIRKQVGAARWSCQFDFKSWYDQIPLSPEIRKFFGVVLRGKTYRLKSLPMGGRQSCEVAQAVTWYLLSFDRPTSVQVATCIDNVRFTSDDREALQAAAQTFLERCNRVGAQINDPEVGVPERIKARDEFCGEVYDYAQKTRQLSDRTVAKIDAVVDLLRRCFVQRRAGGFFTYRRYAAIFGLVFYVSEVLLLELPRSAVKEYCRAMVDTTNFERRDWDRELPAHLFQVAAAASIEALLLVAKNNAPVPVSGRAHRAPFMTIVTDASATGWGAVALCDETVTHRHGQWSVDDLRSGRLTSSVSAEPLGVLRACLSLLEVGASGTVVILTDHQGLVAAAGAGFVWCDVYAETFSRLTELFPGVDFLFRWVDGERNLADSASRGAPVARSREEVIAALDGSLGKTELSVPNQARRQQEWML